MTPTDDEYAAKVAEHEAKLDRLELTEGDLVEQSHKDEAFRRELLARYDAALEARDEAGIASYMVEVEKLRIRHVERKEALDAVRAQYGSLKRNRPRRSRCTLGQLLGVKR